ncbi:YadA-like family protein [Erwinia persicina]|uniref:ESPR-type extended signal peptide-containing protein n=1 Tax=Erwinia persicina TaxID=55211 RepID=UPI00078730F6|nr:ESPR-type extended signal peptide-containing protein [Erwinia persicina]QZQ49800.1 YadA-like family protein [Erwinia persicina]
MNKIFKVIWNKSAQCFVVSSELAKSTVKSGRQKLTPASQKSSTLFSFSLLVSSLLMAMSGSAYAVNAAPPANSINPDYQAANGLISIAGGGKGNAHATDNKNGQNDKSNNDYGIAIGAGSKGFWASVAMGDTAEAQSLYGTAIGPKANIDNASDYAVALGNKASIKTSNNGVVLGSNASLTGAENSVAIGNAASVSGVKNSVAIGANSTATEENTVSIGSKGHERKLVNLADGDVSATSKEAVNGSQLNTTNLKIDAFDGRINDNNANIDLLNQGSAGVIQVTKDKTTLFIGSDIAEEVTTFDLSTTKTVDGEDVTTNRKMTGLLEGIVEKDSTDAVNGNQLFKTEQEVLQNTGDITNLNTGKAGLVQLEGQNLFFGSAAANAMVFNVGNRTISGVKAATLSADSTEAVNGSQLHDTNARIDKNSDDIAKLAGNSSGGGAGGMLQMSGDGQSLVVSEAGKGATSLNLDGLTINGIGAGELSATSTEAVNGSQLFETNQQVSKNTTDISKLSTDISSGKTGVTQIDGDKIVFNDGGKGTTTLDVGGRNVANIKEGELSKNSKDAVNGSQLFETNTHVEQNTANIEINRTDINKNKTDIANNSSKITDLENSFSGMNHSFRSLAKEVNKNKKRADAGIAGAMAMTAIPHVYSDDFSFGMSMSGYRDQGALAAGVTVKTSEHTAMKVNSSWDTQNGAGVAAGFAWGW